VSCQILKATDGAVPPPSLFDEDEMIIPLKLEAIMKILGDRNFITP
jgi:hypothetical protein